MSMKAKMLRALGGVLLKEAQLVSADEVGAGYRKLVLRGRDMPPPGPGTKLQILVPGDEVRTYSPIADGEGFALLGWMHAGGPGAAWIAGAQAGETVHFVGPQSSLVLPDGPVIVVGDETSVAVAASYAVGRSEQVQGIFSVRDPEATRTAAAAVGLRQLDAFSAGDVSLIVDAVLASRAQRANATVAITGGSELVLAVRTGLREKGAKDLKTKTYWIPGRAGLD